MSENLSEAMRALAASPAATAAVPDADRAGARLRRRATARTVTTAAVATCLVAGAVVVGAQVVRDPEPVPPAVTDPVSPSPTPLDGPLGSCGSAWPADAVTSTDGYAAGLRIDAPEDLGTASPLTLVDRFQTGGVRWTVTVTNISETSLAGWTGHPSTVLVRDGIVVGDPGAIEDLGLAADLPPGGSADYEAANLLQDCTTVGVGEHENTGQGDPLLPGEYQVYAIMDFFFEQPTGTDGPDGERTDLRAVGGPWTVTVTEDAQATPELADLAALAELAPLTDLGTFPACGAPVPSIHAQPDTGLTMAADLPAGPIVAGQPVEFTATVGPTQGRTVTATSGDGRVTLWLAYDGIVVGGVVDIYSAPIDLDLGPQDVRTVPGHGATTVCGGEYADAPLPAGTYQAWPAMGVTITQVTESDGTVSGVSGDVIIVANPQQVELTD